jgi:flavodoxin
MQLNEVFAGVDIGAHIGAGNVQVFPLLRPGRGTADYALLDDLIDEGLAEVVEVDEHGSVPTLKVRNRSARDALLLDGTELRGAKQNRMVNVTIIVGAGQETEIPVACVEAGRWQYRERQFRSSRRTVASKLRRDKAFHVHASFALRGEARADQVRVWERVGEYIGATGAAAPSEALDDAFESRKFDLDAVVDALQKLDADGAVVAINGEIVALDLLDCRDTFRKVWPGLLRGYAMDAVVDAEHDAKTVEPQRVRAWLDEVTSRARLTPQRVPGVGGYSALFAEHAAGGVADRGGKAVHIAVFSRPQ